MKVFDASGIIGMLREIGRPGIIDMIIKLGHRVAVPSAVMEKELVEECVCRMVGELVAQGKISVLRACLPDEMSALQHEYPELGLGECEVILHCQRSGEGVYGILDDKQARAAAEELNIRYTGLVGLIKLLGDREIATPIEIRKIFEAMMSSTFRAPADVVGSYQAGGS